MTDTSNANTESAKSFSEFGLHPDLLKAISASGYTVATPIQAQAIPAIIDGRDVMGAAQTGTGKTAAFTLPLLHRLMPYASHSTSPARHPVRALILAPTRELADQVADSVKRYSESCPLRVAVVFGGVDISAQKEELRKGCELVIATPGRLLDHIEQKTINLSFGGGGGAQGFSDIFGFGGGGGGSRRRLAQPMRGHDIKHDTSVSFKQAMEGGEINLNVRRPNGEMDRLTAKIPPGIEDGKKIRLRGQGDSGPGGGPNGDLLIRIHIEPHKYFKRNGKDLEVQVPVTLAEAMLGGSVDVPTPGGTVTMKIPPGSSSGRRLRVRGQGVPRSKGDAGDLYVVLQVTLPEHPSDELKAAVQSYAERHSDENPRKDLRW